MAANSSSNSKKASLAEELAYQEAVVEQARNAATEKARRAQQELEEAERQRRAAAEALRQSQEKLKRLEALMKGAQAKATKPTVIHLQHKEGGEMDIETQGEMGAAIFRQVMTGGTVPDSHAQQKQVDRQRSVLTIHQSPDKQKLSRRKAPLSDQKEQAKPATKPQPRYIL